MKTLRLVLILVTVLLVPTLGSSSGEGSYTVFLPAVAREHENLYLELTAVLDDRGAMEKFVAAGLTNQLLFGTDLPWFDPHHGIGAVLSADIVDIDRHNILHRNAEALLGVAF